MTPFISHARNHKPAGGPASSRAAAPQWLDVMAHLHNMAPRNDTGCTFQEVADVSGRRVDAALDLAGLAQIQAPTVVHFFQGKSSQRQPVQRCSPYVRLPRRHACQFSEPGGCHPASRRLVGTFGGHAGSGVDGGFTTCQGFNAAFPPFRFILIRMTANVTRRILTAITLAPTATQIAATGALGG